jgi:NAD(P)-dependent dehydrogenase (short-subunit alcohol dehydrogenase family)
MSKKVLVVGGAKGMGAAIVASVAAAGHDVVFSYRSSAAQAEALAAEVAASHPERVVEARALDLADASALEQFCARIAEEGPFHGVVHVAGQTYDTLAAVMDRARAEAVMAVNFFSLTRVVAATIRDMYRARSGRIVAIGSVTALQGNQGNAAYAASKGALLSYCRTLAVESAKRNVTVNYVAPGFVDTDMMAPYADYRATMEKRIPAGRFGKPEDIGEVVRFLLSPGAAYVTGAVLPVDGGLSAALPAVRD